MQIPDELFKKWTVLRSHGDGKKIAESNKGAITRTDVSRAFTNQECTDDIFKIIADFYSKKEKKVKAYLQ